MDQWEYSALHEAASKDHRVIFSLLVKVTYVDPDNILAQ